MTNLRSFLGFLCVTLLYQPAQGQVIDGGMLKPGDADGFASDAKAARRFTTDASLQAENHFVSSGTSGFNGVEINSFLGASRFYNNGFTGSGVIVANIEAGIAAGNVPGMTGTYAGGHETLSQVNTFFASSSNPQTMVNLVDRHATWTAQAIAGRNNGSSGNAISRGIAYGSTLWSGAVATSWIGTSGYRGSFDIATDNDMANPYRAAILNDLAPGSLTSTTALVGKARVVNSSWGFSDPTASAYETVSRISDALSYARGTGGDAAAIVFSAGNSGQGDGTVSGSKVGGPAAGYNVISVGALGTDSSNPKYNSVSSFSSRGLMPVFVPKITNPTDINNAAQGTIINSARVRVDISAPGEQLTLAYYGGVTGGNQSPSQSGTPNGATNSYSTGLAGTSFAAPTVAGGLALLADAGSTLPAENKPLDGRVLKAVAMNSADKTAGWNNASTGGGVKGNPYSTTQGVDASVGAGRMNLDRAFDQYMGGTRGVTDPTGGTVSPLGWAFGSVSQTSPFSDYRFAQSVSAGTNFAATLSFFVNRSVDAANNTLEQRFDNLDLFVYQLDSFSGAILPGNLVASSTSVYNTSEHIYFNLPADGFYAIRVAWQGTNWNFTGTTGANYGLAWSAVPEPSSFLLVAIGSSAGVWARYRRTRVKRID